MTEPILVVRQLRATFHRPGGDVRAVDGVSFDVGAGEVVGLVGESGSGKTVTALSVLGLVPSPDAEIESGEIIWKGRDLRRLGADDLRRVRGAEIAMIFQDPSAALNPVFTVGSQIADVVRAHTGASKAAARARAIEVLDLVGIPRPGSRVDDYPHQLSGGLRQRALIAMALANGPDLLIADEPTSALDVTTQAQVLDVIQRAATATAAAVLLVTHDLGVVAGLARRVIVMYAGQIVEEGPVDALYYRPRMPYSWGLLDSISRPDDVRARLRPIAGQPPDMAHPPGGCRFHPRCPYRDDDCCVRLEPELIELDGGHRARCHDAAAGGWWSPSERPAVPAAGLHPLIAAREAELAGRDTLAGGPA